MHCLPVRNVYIFIFLILWVMELRLRELTASEYYGLTTSGLVSSAHLRPSPHLSISHKQGLPRVHTYPSQK